MAADGLSRDLEWWRANRASPKAEGVVLVELLARLKAWKAQHDEDRARQAGPFLLMVWDGIFGDDDAAVCQAIREIEAVLDEA